MNKNLNRLFFVLALLILAMTWVTDGTFITPRNLTNLGRQISINGILAVGMTYVILIGGIDLSVGSVVALASVAVGLLQFNLGLATWTGPLELASTLISVLGAVFVGLLFGILNGWMITKQRIAPFIITLGTMVIARGLALVLAKGAAIAPLGEHFNLLGQGFVSPMLSGVLIAAIGLVLWKRVIGFEIVRHWRSATALLAGLAAALYVFLSYRGIPYPVLLFVLLALGAVFVLSETRLGRFVLAIGGNIEAAWLAGVPILPIKFGIYAMLGALSGLCGAILSARLNGALPTSGELFELDAIAAVVIGGTSLLGGIGSIQGSVLGAVFIGVLNNGMSLMDVSEFYQKIIKGVIIVLAVWIDMRKTAPASGPAPAISS